jgi:hypothetical protein
MHEKASLSIWFFVGVMLVAYGIIILIANIPAFSSPAGNPHVVLEQLHSGVWWGAILLILGLVFLIPHWPGKKPTSLDETPSGEE